VDQHGVGQVFVHVQHHVVICDHAFDGDVSHPIDRVGLHLLCDHHMHIRTIFDSSAGLSAEVLSNGPKRRAQDGHRDGTLPGLGNSIDQTTVDTLNVRLECEGDGIAREILPGPNEVFSHLVRSAGIQVALHRRHHFA